MGPFESGLMDAKDSSENAEISSTFSKSYFANWLQGIVYMSQGLGGHKADFTASCFYAWDL